MDFDFFAYCRDEIRSSLDALTEQAAQGSPQDYASYQRLVGAISSYKQIQDFLDDLEKKYLEQ